MALRTFSVTGLVFSLALAAAAQRPPADQIRAYAQHAAEASIEEFRACLALANDAHFPEDVEANVAWTEAAFAKRGFRTRRLDTGGPPLLLAELGLAAGKDTVLVYLQMDGQPVDSTFWRQPNPYGATLKAEVEGEGYVTQDWSVLDEGWQDDLRVFARSTSDAKGPVVMLLAALDALRQNRLQPAFGIKVILDFEEELGSPHLPAAVTRHRDALAASRLVIFDGPMHPSNRPTLAFGARGITTVTLETFGPRAPQHSGHYGNFVPNPAWDLIRALAPLRDDAGRVTLDGWYDGITIDAATRATLEGVPDDVDALRAQLALGRVDAVGASLQEALQYPSLNIRGLQSGWVREERRTLVPATAIVEVDIRTVVESDPEKLLGLLREHLEGLGYLIVEGREPTVVERTTHPRVIRWDAETSYAAFRTALDFPTGRWPTEALTHVHGEVPVRIRTMGGSIPISPFVTTLGIPAVSVPTVNSDNNQHAPNENLRLGNYRDGIATMIGILTSASPAR